jgi:hypothetical protein
MSTQTDSDIAVANRNSPPDNEVQNITSSPSVTHDCVTLSDEMNPGGMSSASASAPILTLAEKSNIRTYDGKTESAASKYSMLCRFFERGFVDGRKNVGFYIYA